MSWRNVLVMATAPVVGSLAGIAITLVVGSSSADTAPSSSRFRDVAAEHGLVTRQPGADPCGYNAAGAAWGDVEGDGDLDLFLARQRGDSELWIQGRSGEFSERGRGRGVAAAGIATAAAFADVDDDRDQDLFVGAAGPDTLFVNLGDGRFAPRSPTGMDFLPLPVVSGAQRHAADQSVAMSIGFADFDGDRRLDVHVATGRNCSANPPPSPDRLLRNLGETEFRDVGHRILPDVAAGATLDATWIDVDLDGDDDLYLGNDDLTGHRNGLLANEDGALVDISPASGADLSRFTMGVAGGDIDVDGDVDLAATDIGREALLVQRASGEFEEQSEERGFGRERTDDGEESITWGIALADFDNDADLDGYAAGGALGLATDRHDDVLYENDGGGRFQRLDVPAPGSGRTVAAADWDRDGDVDLLVTQLDGAPLLLENRGPPSRSWIELSLVGRRSPRDACGAIVRLRTGALEQLREVQCRSGDRVLHFGLGKAKAVSEIVIDWPSGTRQRLARMPAGRVLDVREPAR